MKIYCSSFDDYVKVYYIYINDERYSTEFYNYEDAVANAQSMANSGKYAGAFFEVEEDIWDSRESYNSYAPADSQRTVWQQHSLC